MFIRFCTDKDCINKDCMHHPSRDADEKAIECRVCYDTFPGCMWHGVKEVISSEADFRRRNARVVQYVELSDETIDRIAEAVYWRLRGNT